MFTGRRRARTFSAIARDRRYCIVALAKDRIGTRSFDPFKYTTFTADLLRLVGEIDEFKGAWKALGNLAPDRLATLRRVATVESVGASTRIEGAKLTDAQ